MNNREQEIIKTFKGKECLYKESRRISHVLVKELTVDKEKVEFKLEIISSRQAFHSDDGLEYENVPEKLNSSFIFSGVWDITSFRDKMLHVAYVNGELNAKQKSLQLFKEEETDFFKIWRHNQ